VIFSQRGTGGSSGGFGFFDEQERQDLYDVVEWAAEQPWSERQRRDDRHQLLRDHRSERRPLARRT
jgi:hypothetical protein